MFENFSIPSADRSLLCFGTFKAAQMQISFDLRDNSVDDFENIYIHRKNRKKCNLETNTLCSALRCIINIEKENIFFEEDIKKKQNNNNKKLATISRIHNQLPVSYYFCLVIYMLHNINERTLTHIRIRYIYLLLLTQSYGLFSSK